MSGIAVSEARTIPADVKYIGDLVGCYVLSSREKYEGGPRVFGCRSRSISSRMAVLQAPVPGAVGETVGLKLDTLGLLKASIQRLTDDGFVVELLLDDADRATLLARIGWLKRHHAQAATERRQSKRWLPRTSQSSLLLSGRRQLGCFVIDVSTTGAAVSADTLLAVSQPVAVGNLLARVVRPIEYGFAVEFVTEQTAAGVEAALVPPGDERREALMRLLDAAAAAAAQAAG